MGAILHGENEVFQRNRNDFPKVSFTLDVIWGHVGHYFAIGIKWLRRLFSTTFFNLFTGVIDYAPQIFLRAFSGAGAIAPVSWPSLLYSHVIRCTRFSTIRKPHRFFEWKYHTSGLSWPGNPTIPQVEWVSQAKKTMSVIFRLKKHMSAIFCLSHDTKWEHFEAVVLAWIIANLIQKFKNQSSAVGTTACDNPGSLIKSVPALQLLSARLVAKGLWKWGRPRHTFKYR
jgi:hypothetical protein